MTGPLDFADKIEFELWLKDNHQLASGTDIFIYKKGHESEGLTYEDAVRTALCYGWIDAVTHSYDEVKFIQYFAPRKKNSNWSLSNLIRMRDLIDDHRMTDHGLKFFDMTWLDNLNERIAEEERLKTQAPEIPDYFLAILKETDSENLFRKETKAYQRRIIQHIQEARQQTTRIRRCHKIINILRGDEDNP